jgi:hypothetical protein
MKNSEDFFPGNRGLFLVQFFANYQDNTRVFKPMVKPFFQLKNLQYAKNSQIFAHEKFENH